MKFLFPKAVFASFQRPWVMELFLRVATNEGGRGGRLVLKTIQKYRHPRVVRIDSKTRRLYVFFLIASSYAVYHSGVFRG
jgi:hypothetical protein